MEKPISLCLFGHRAISSSSSVLHDLIRYLRPLTTKQIINYEFIRLKQPTKWIQNNSIWYVRNSENLIIQIKKRIYIVISGPVTMISTTRKIKRGWTGGLLGTNSENRLELSFAWCFPVATTARYLLAGARTCWGHDVLQNLLPNKFCSKTKPNCKPNANLWSSNKTRTKTRYKMHLAGRYLDFKILFPPLFEQEIPN